LSVQPGAKGSHHADKILDQILLAVFGQIDPLDLPALPPQQLLDVVEPKASQTIFMFHHDQADGGVGQQLQRFGRASLTPDPISLTTAVT